jgi:hypothetical protein
MTGLPCARPPRLSESDGGQACPVTNVQAMGGAVRATGLIWVAVLKRDPHAPGLPRALARGASLGNHDKVEEENCYDGTTESF